MIRKTIKRKNIGGAHKVAQSQACAWEMFLFAWMLSGAPAGIPYNFRNFKLSLAFLNSVCGFAGNRRLVAVIGPTDYHHNEFGKKASIDSYLRHLDDSPWDVTVVLFREGTPKLEEKLLLRSV